MLTKSSAYRLPFNAVKITGGQVDIGTRQSLGALTSTPAGGGIRSRKCVVAILGGLDVNWLKANSLVPKRISGREAAQAVRAKVVQGPALSLAASTAARIGSTLPTDILRSLLRQLAVSKSIATSFIAIAC
jgi:hypothetical protein